MRATIIEVRRDPSPADLGAHDLQGEVLPAPRHVDLDAILAEVGLPEPPPGLREEILRRTRSRFLLEGAYALVPDLGDTPLPTPWAFRPLDEDAAEASRRAAQPADGKRAKRPKASGDPAFTPRPTAEVQADLDAVDELIDRLNAERNGLRFVLRQRASGEER